MEDSQKDLKDKAVESGNISQPYREGRSGRVLAGLIVVVIGSLLFARQAGAAIPWWIFSWQMLLVGIGLFVGARHSFRGFAWLIPIIIGGVFLIEDFEPALSFKEYIWPVAVIIVGLFIIARPRRTYRRRRRWDSHGREKWERWERRGRQRWEHWETSTQYADDAIDVVSIFGGTKKIIISKDFKGGDITTIFGGTDIDLMQADINGTVTIDVTNFFGGTKLIVPSHWNIKSDVVCVFGSIEDKRSPMKETSDPGKVLRLDGTCAFGGIEIKNY